MNLLQKTSFKLFGNDSIIRYQFFNKRWKCVGLSIVKAILDMLGCHYEVMNKEDGVDLPWNLLRN